MVRNVICVISAILLCLGIPFGCARAEGGMTMMVFNVGKADSILLQSGEMNYLIDTGRSSTWDMIEEGLEALQVDHLDGVILTHTDSDHIGGLKKLLKSDIAVDHVYASAFFCDESGKDKENPIVKTAAKQGYEVEFLQGGEELPFEDGKLNVLGPVEENEDKDDSNSVVLLAETSGGSFLLAGDMEFPEEASLLSAGVIPQADVLKVGNHGDNDATSEALLSAVQPKIAVVSTSTEEKASTPAKRVLKSLANWDVEVYQTQEADWGIRVTAGENGITAERVDELP